MAQMEAARRRNGTGLNRMVVVRKKVERVCTEMRGF